MILLLDNYDSFVHNLARHFRRLGQSTLVLRSDALEPSDIARIAPRAVVLSPGPCTPREAGCSLEVVRQWHQRLPMLGVCLGHQTIAAALGGRVRRTDLPVHGRASRIEHDGSGLFAGLANPFSATRYHSLVVDEASLPDCLLVNARTPDGVVMALAHRALPVFGVQFHPESILTEQGYELLAAFLRIAGLAVPGRLPPRDDELAAAPAAAPLPRVPVTF